MTACGGGGAPTTATPAVAPTSSVDAYTGPAPATADVQAFEVNFWNNVRGQNRCGQCHNATTPAQMPNFARSDNVNLAYAQANTVVNLAQPSTSMMVTKVSGGHNCWLADNSACGADLDHLDHQLGERHRGSVGDAGRADRAAGSVRRPELELSPAIARRTTRTRSIRSPAQYCSRCHSPNATPATQQSPYFAAPVPQILDRLSGRDPEDRLHRCSPFAGNMIATATTPGSCGTNSRFYQRLAIDNHNCWSNCTTDAALMLAQIQAFAQMLTPTNIDPIAGRQQGAVR